MLKRFRSLFDLRSKDSSGADEVSDSAAQDTLSPQDCTHATLVARQPIFDRESRIWGFELLFRRAPDTNHCPDGVDSSIATSSVISDGFSIVQPVLLPDQKVLINFSEELLTQQIPKVLPAALCGVEILETVLPTREVLQSLIQLKKDGYLLAVDDYTGQKDLQLFVKVADIVKVEVLGRPLAEVYEDVKKLKAFPCRLLAEKVEDRDTFLKCHKMGFDLFQGFFFARPEIMRGKKLSASQAVKMRLLAKLADEDFLISEVSEILRSDVSLVYKFMRYLNSVHFALPTKIKSVEHGITLLGSQKLKQWLCVTVLSDLESTPMSRHIVAQSAERGKFLELLGKDARTSVDVNSLFLLGLLSLIETLLSISLDSLLQDMPIDEAMVAALKGEESVYLPWMRLVSHYERAEWDEALHDMTILGLEEAQVVSAYEQSLLWAASFFD
ncbi:HDOD domain-containing protein [Desulfovibrio mangrovi]|uniref:EAL and HDOD domain-containing protein n=1 Tax=Desulfovibrio mangrovi TaxID=2976983 RepID=UPI002245CA7C|nr:HDOD domain-containing protein [Desulfovibrio mangrovi]UZP68001.1 HDOD domain-containing protein [Desulfovibrio mangrovi]